MLFCLSFEKLPIYATNRLREFELYVADPRASEWDIAAGDAILRNAGGSVKDMDGNEIFYGKKDLKNPSLVIKSARLLNNE